MDMINKTNIKFPIQAITIEQAEQYLGSLVALWNYENSRPTFELLEGVSHNAAHPFSDMYGVHYRYCGLPPLDDEGCFDESLYWKDYN
jgi:hypothetical protein